LNIVPKYSTIINVNGKHQKTLHAIFINPPPSNINWTDIESLLKSLGAESSEGSGSRIKLNNIRAIFHRPHPQKETDKGAVKSMKRFLESTGVKP
jgi:hypothetical protein